MTVAQDYFIVQPGSRSIQTYAANLEEANRRLTELQFEQPDIGWYLIDPEEFLHRKEAEFLNQPVIEISAEKYDEMLNILPPLNWVRADGVERFNMCEFLSGPITNQYARVGDRYFTKPVRHGDKSTYMTIDILRPFLENHS